MVWFLMSASAQQPPVSPSEPLLPRLREDLVLRAGAVTSIGEPSWLIYDGLQHRYIQIDRATFMVLSVWPRVATAAHLSDVVLERFNFTFTTDEVVALGQFLQNNRLTVDGARQGWRDLSAAATASKHGFVMTMVHNYLFLRVPLFRPEAFLRRTLWLVMPLFARTTAGMLGMLAGVGLYLVSRRIDVFMADFRGLMTADGAWLFALTLFVVKVAHELGHAYTAVRFGVRVPTMGIAVMMMAPMLYTDVTDAWRLANRRQRLLIDAAGVVVELGLAVVATIMWVFLAEGVMRNIMFLIATTSWMMSVFVNLNPLMRFDGYYILADLIRVDNLQPRAFVLGQWKLREWLFRLRVRCPENLSPSMVRALVLYAWAIWIYRFFLFLGIALVVYAYFFKLLGVALFVFEIGYFIARPVFNELKIWWMMRATLRNNRRAWVTGAGVIGLVLGVVVPWSSAVYVPAVMEARDMTRLFPPRAARVVSVHVAPGQVVAAGALLVQLEAPDLSHELSIVQMRLIAVRARLARRGADNTDREDNLVLESELAALVMRQIGLLREHSDLAVRAQRSGEVVEFNTQLLPGRWLGAKEPIATIVEGTAASALGYIGEADLWRVQAGVAGWFIPDDAAGAAIPVTLKTVAIAGAVMIDIPELAQPHGGRIAVQPDSRQKLVPTLAQYMAVMETDESVVRPAMQTRGLVQLVGQRESLFARGWRQVLKVLVRESST
jgi:putative peptide zinc metalloprotease protein